MEYEYIILKVRKIHKLLSHRKTNLKLTGILLCTAIALENNKYILFSYR